MGQCFGSADEVVDLEGLVGDAVGQDLPIFGGELWLVEVEEGVEVLEQSWSGVDVEVNGAGGWGVSHGEENGGEIGAVVDMEVGDEDGGDVVEWDLGAGESVEGAAAAVEEDGALG